MGRSLSSTSESSFLRDVKGDLIPRKRATRVLCSPQEKEGAKFSADISEKFMTNFAGYIHLTNKQ